MKIEFLRDYQDFKAGDVVELDEETAEDLCQSAVVQPYRELGEVQEIKKPVARRARKQSK